MNVKQDKTLKELGFNSLLDVVQLRFSDFKKRCNGDLSNQRLQEIYQRARAYKEKLLFQKRGMLARSNRQLASNRFLAINYSQVEQYGREVLFAPRAAAYAAQGSVSSMFSPAAYLCQLYHEAREFHSGASELHLDKRRPDLQHLVLSDSNLNGEISTLSLANEILQAKIGKPNLYQDLSKTMYPCNLPYHEPYEVILNALALQKSSFTDLVNILSDVMQIGVVKNDTHAAFGNKLSPELYKNLETVPQGESALNQALEGMFGTYNLNTLSNIDYLCRSLNISRDRLNEHLAYPVFKQSQNFLASEFDTAPFSVAPDSYGARYINAKHTQGGFVQALDNELLINSSTLIPAKTGNDAAASEVICVVLPIADMTHIRFRYKCKKPEYSRKETKLKIFVDDHWVESRTVKNSIDQWLEFSVPIKSAQGTIKIEHLFLADEKQHSSLIAYEQKFEPLAEAHTLLRLGKTLRLLSQVNVTPESVDNLCYLAKSSTAASLEINQSTLECLARVQEYMNTYSVTEENARVLVGDNISIYAPDGKVSQFDRLFNSPQMFDSAFTVGTVSQGSKQISFEPSDTAFSHERAVLKRAMGINDLELRALVDICSPASATVLGTLQNISVLYRVGLWAKLNQINLLDLKLLLQILGIQGGFLELNVATLAQCFATIRSTCQWLVAQKLSVMQLWYMITKDYPTTMTPEIDNFVTSLYQGGQASQENVSNNPEVLKRNLAPHIASAFGLATDTAFLMEKWIELIATDQQLTLKTMQAFYLGIQAYVEKTSTAGMDDIVKFSQALAQLALIIKNWNFTVHELEIIVNPTNRLKANLSYVPLSVNMIQLVSAFSALVHELGDNANEFLTELSQCSLNIKKLATLFGYSEREVAQAAVYAGINATNSLTVDNVRAINKWIKTAGTLGLTVDSLYQLLALSVNSEQYASWKTVSLNLQAAVPEGKEAVLHEMIDEARSTALCAYFLQNVSLPIPIQSREDIFQYLLIDNQVNAKVTTSRIAEAIASLQLYVSRCLHGLERDVNGSILLDSEFLQKWDQCNKRYAMWAAAAQLAYYPENYVDPSLRSYQSELQQRLEQDLNGGGKLDQVRAEKTFNHYLTGFEAISNMKILSGYHDGLELDDGITYFVGRTVANPPLYYWRCLDQQQSNGCGAYYAQSWSEWLQINTSMGEVYNDEIRLVDHHDRLFVFWIEKAKKENSQDKSKNSENAFSLKLSYKNIDGSWSVPLSFDLKGVSPALLSSTALKIYASYHVEKNQILVMLYDIAELGKSYNDSVKNKLYYGIWVSLSAEFYPEVDQANTGNLFKEFYDKFFQKNDKGDPIIQRIQLRQYEVQCISEKPVLLNKSEMTEIKTAGVLSHVNYDTNSLVCERYAEVSVGDYEGLYKEKLEVLEVIPTTSLHFSPIKNEVSFRINNEGEKPEIVILYNFTLKRYDNYPMLARIRFGEPERLVEQILNGEFQLDDEQNQIYSGTVSLGTGSDEIIDEFVQFELYATSGLTRDYYILRYKMSVQKETKDTVVKAGFDEMLFDVTPPGQFIQDVNEYPLTKQTKMTSFTVKEIDKITSKEVEIYQQKFTINCSEKTWRGNSDFYYVARDENGVEYLASTIAPYRTRLNSLFAPILIKRISKGLNVLLSLETQNLTEPQLGSGFYLEVTLPEYKPLYGEDRSFQINYFIPKSQATDSADIIFPLNKGVLSGEGTTSVTLFYPIYHISSDNKYHLHILCGTALYKVEMTAESPYSTVNIQCPSGIEPIEHKKQSAEPIDFNGCNGLYLWELFYYSPLLVANKLLIGQQYDECEKWINYIFNPQGYFENEKLTPRKWNVRPLLEDTTWDDPFLNDTVVNNDDPDIISLLDPMHYKVYVFMKRLDVLIAKGDSLYRMLERDTLAEAKLCYITALNLLGDEPDTPLTGNWKDPSLGLAASHKSSVSDDVQPSSLFLPPENDKLHGYWKLVKQRLFNLRNNLTLEGLPLHLSLYATPVDPMVMYLSRANNEKSSGAEPIVACKALYRFSQIHADAKALVSYLSQVGASLLSAMERLDAEAFNVLMQDQAFSIMDTSIEAQDEVINQAVNAKRSLEKSKDSVQLQFNTYNQWLAESAGGIDGVNNNENTAMVLKETAGGLQVSTSALAAAGSAAQMVPNIFGLADGGSNWGGAFAAVVAGIAGAATGLEVAAQALEMEEQYRRRAQQWKLMRDEAKGQLNQIDEQLKAAQNQIDAAQKQRDYLCAQKSNLAEQINFIKVKSTNEALFNWMKGKISSIYYQLYGLVFSRCKMAEESYRWETNDNRSVFIKGGAWDGYHSGLLAGDILLSYLLNMENAYRNWDSRALEINRTVSFSSVMAAAQELNDKSFNQIVRGLLEDNSSDYKGASSGIVLKKVSAADGTVSLAFEIQLAKLNIADDYPPALLGEKCLRRIKHIGISLPALLGPYQDIQALLSFDSMAQLHTSCAKVAISHGVDDSGLFQLNFQDDKYLPFEGIDLEKGGVFTLTFPNAQSKQKTLLQSLNDIILHIRYTIRGN